MSLEQISANAPGQSIPASIDTYLRDAGDRINLFMDIYNDRDHERFVPSEYHSVYDHLATIIHSGLIQSPTKARFCEWGCGMGVVAGLAAMLGFNAAGIEINATLIPQAQTLMSDYLLEVRIEQGSLFPHDPDEGYTRIGKRISDFDLLFAYPWPDETEQIFETFEKHAESGALLLTYHGIEDVRLHRKTG